MLEEGEIAPANSFMNDGQTTSPEQHPSQTNSTPQQTPNQLTQSQPRNTPTPSSISINKLKIEETVEAAKLITDRLISIHRVRKEAEKLCNSANTNIDITNTNTNTNTNTTSSTTKRTFQDANLNRLTPLRDSTRPGEVMDFSKLDKTPPPSPLTSKISNNHSARRRSNGSTDFNTFAPDFNDDNTNANANSELPEDIEHVPIQESTSTDSFTTAKSESFDRLPEMQVELLQSELEELQAKYSAVFNEKNDLLQVLAEYEEAMSKMIVCGSYGNSFTSSSNNPNANANANNNQNIQSNQSTDILSLKNLTLDDGIAFSNLKGKFEEARLIIDKQRQTEEGLREMISNLQAELLQADKRYSVFKAGAEDRIADANEELFRIKNSLETELSSSKAKLSRSELRISSLEAAVASKTKENAELMAISDELIQRIDNNH